MIFVFIAFVLAAMVVYAWLAGQQRGTLVGLALHPFNVIGMLTTLVAIDFITLYNDSQQGRISEILGYLIVSPGPVIEGVVFFMLCSLGVMAGVVAASISSMRRATGPAAQEPGRADLASASIVMAIAAACMISVAAVVIWESLAEGSILRVAGLRQVFFRENQALAILGGVGIPAFFLYGSRVGMKRSTWIYALVLVACLLPIGSRSSIVFLGLGLAFWWSQSHNLRISHAYLGFVPLVMLSTFYRYLTRDAYIFSSFGEFLSYNGGFFGVLFRSPDISMAEGITAAVTQSTVTRGPLDTILAALMAPVPRSWIDWKPFSASAEFTRNATPEHFEKYGSAWTVTGFVNLFLEYGYWLTIPMVFILAWIWARIWIASEGQRASAGLAGPVLILVAYTFFRADLYDVALFLWPLAAVLGLHMGIRGMLRGSIGRPGSLGYQLERRGSLRRGR